MADIRINALATTAASTASDDYIAIDGSANGTRKLDAYSPTFGGNLTVSGTATIGPSADVKLARGPSGAGNLAVTAATDGYCEITARGTAGNLRIFSSYTGGNFNWYWGADASAQTGSNAGSNFVLVAGSDVGGSLGTYLTVNRATAATTLAGNLTVSGTGNSSFAGKLTVGTSPLADRMFYVSGNTGTSGASQFSAVINPTLPNTVTTSAYGLYLATNIASGATVTNAYSLYVAAPTYAGSTVTNKWGLYIEDTNKNYVSGNLLIGTTTDSGNGKLQLATHTTSAGGIGFGTDTSLFRAASGNLGLYGTGTSSKITFSHSTTTAGKGFELECDTSKDGYIWNRENRNIFFGTNNTLALTLDSSQNATFANGLVAGKTSSVNTITGGDAGAGTSIISFKDGLGATKVNITGDGKMVLSNTTASTSTSTGALQVSGGVGVVGAVNVGGAISIGNTVQTAASVASTHKVTVVIGGVTYYLLATNV